MVKNKTTKEHFKEIRGIFTSSFILFSIFALLVLGASKAYANINTTTSINECKTSGYSKSIINGDIDSTKMTKAEYQAKCMTLQKDINELLNKYSDGNKDFPVYITGFDSTLCGEHTLGCVSNIYALNENISPVMTIAYNASDELTLEHVIAHEYIHTLTSHAEAVKLDLMPDIWDGVDPSEGVADCGISYFTKTLTQGTYIKECSQEQTMIAQAVIENSYINGGK